MERKEYKYGSLKINFIPLLVALLVITLIVAVLPMTTTGNVAAATATLESRGYVVLSGSEYTTLLSQINAVKAKTDNLPNSPANEVTAAAAVVNAESAALSANATLDTLLLHNENTIYLFPEIASANITFTAGDGVDTYGAWAEIASNNGTTLSSKFALNSGYLSEMWFRDYSAVDKMCVIEIAYGAAKTVVGRIKVRSDFTWCLNISSVVIPAGETIYYRMQSTQPLETAKVDFRYYFR